MRNLAIPYNAEYIGRGGISAKVVAYSISKVNHKPIITWQLCYPRFIHGELMTHRLFSRNAASSRAIPITKMMKQVRQDPAMPIHWGQNQPGMQAKGELTDMKRKFVIGAWKVAAFCAATMAGFMNRCTAHKQVANRILEPFQFMQTVVTATELNNFFNLRIHKDAQPEIHELAKAMQSAMLNSVPAYLEAEQWHLPYVSDQEIADIGIVQAIHCSASRCARVSYLNHDNSKPSVNKDLGLYNMLAVRPFDDGKGHVLGEDDPVHLSPLEHQARPMLCTNSDSGLEAEIGTTMLDRQGNYWSGNFKSWIQFRQMQFTD